MKQTLIANVATDPARRTGSLLVWMLVLAAPLALLALSAVGCMKKSAAERPAARPGWQAEGKAPSQYRALLESDEEIRWAYATTPDPGSSGKPVVLLRSFRFPAGSADLDREGSAVLRDFTPALQNEPGRRILIVGFADSGSEQPGGQSLGLRRAEAARDRLVGNGIDRGRIEVATFGSSQAKGPASDPVSAAMDRRVEIWLVEG